MDWIRRGGEVEQRAENGEVCFFSASLFPESMTPLRPTSNPDKYSSHGGVRG